MGLSVALPSGYLCALSLSTRRYIESVTQSPPSVDSTLWILQCGFHTTEGRRASCEHRPFSICPARLRNQKMLNLHFRSYVERDHSFDFLVAALLGRTGRTNGAFKQLRIATSVEHTGSSANAESRQERRPK